MAASLLGTALSLGASALASKKQKNNANQSADFASGNAFLAAQQQADGIDDGLAQSKTLYNQSRKDLTNGTNGSISYLQPYMDRGEEGNSIFRDILGFNGTGGQDDALSQYQSSPGAKLLESVRSEAVRRSVGEHSANGMLRSGAMTESLARRLSDLDLGEYNKWQGNALGYAGNILGQGGQAASQAAGIRQGQGVGLAGLAESRGNNVMSALANKGTALASGTIGSTNARLAGNQAATNADTNFLGKLGQTDFSGAFGGGKSSGGDVGLGSWIPSISFG